MSAAAAVALTYLSPTHLSTNKLLFSSTHTPTAKTTLSLRPFLFRVQYLSPKRSSKPTGFKPFSPPVMEWQDCTVKREIDVPVAVAYKCYLDRESIPRWMPFISSVKILEDKPDLSRWSLKYKAFGRDIEFSWLARNMQPIPNQKIHWRSLEGLPNRGAVRFFPKGPSSCTVELTVSYEVPQLLVPVASDDYLPGAKVSGHGASASTSVFPIGNFFCALQPFLENLLIRGLERFAKFAKSSLAD